MDTRIKGILILFSLISTFGGALDQWTWRNPLPHGHPIFGFAYGAGKYVGVGEKGLIVVSSNATEWISIQITNGFQPTFPGPPSPIGTETPNFTSVLFAEGRFVAVGGGCWTSVDAVHWNKAGTTNPISLTRANSLYVGAAGNSIMTSEDGVNWTVRASNLEWNLEKITYGNGLYVAGGDLYGTNSIVTSSNGRDWTLRRRAIENFWDIAFGNGRFIAVGLFSLIYSDDGIEWTSVPLSSQLFTGITFHNGVFVGAGAGIWTSPDGLNWTRRYDETQLALYCADSCGDRVIAAGIGSPLVSLDSTNWNRSVGGPSSSIYDLAVGAGAIVAVGRSGLTMTSTNGLSWECRNISSNVSLTAVTYASNRFVAVGADEANPRIFYSVSGKEWSSSDFAFGSLNDIAFENGTFVTVGGDGWGENGRIYTSTNGNTWKLAASNPHALYKVTFGKGTFVIVGTHGTVLTSNNQGLSWQSQTSGVTNDLYAVGFGNGVFVTSDLYGNLMTSTNGSTWNLFKVRTGFYDLTFANGTFVGVGDSIMSSTDAKNWQYRSPHNELGRLNSIIWANDSFIVAGEWGTLVQSGYIGPFSLSSITARPNSIDFIVKIMPGHPFRIEGAASLSFPVIWSSFGPFTNTAISNSFTLQSVASNRFFRAVIP